MRPKVDHPTALRGLSPIGWLSALGLLSCLRQAGVPGARIWWPRTNGTAHLRVPGGLTATEITDIVRAQILAAAPAFRPIETGASWREFADILRAAMREPQYGPIRREEWLSAMVVVDPPPRDEPDARVTLAPWDMVRGKGQMDLSVTIGRALDVVAATPARNKDGAPRKSATDGRARLHAAIWGPWDGMDDKCSARWEATGDMSPSPQQRATAARPAMAGLTMLAAIGVSNFIAAATFRTTHWRRQAGWAHQHWKDRGLPRQAEWLLAAEPANLEWLLAAMRDPHADADTLKRRGLHPVIIYAPVVRKGLANFRQFDSAGYRPAPERHDDD